MDYLVLIFYTESDMTDTQPKQVTAKKAAELIGCDSRTVRRMVERGELIGGQVEGGETLPYLVTLESVQKYIASQQQKERDQSAN